MKIITNSVEAFFYKDWRDEKEHYSHLWEWSYTFKSKEIFHWYTFCEKMGEGSAENCRWAKKVIDSKCTCCGKEVPPGVELAFKLIQAGV